MATTERKSRRTAAELEAENEHLRQRIEFLEETYEVDQSPEAVALRKKRRDLRNLFLKCSPMDPVLNIPTISMLAESFPTTRVSIQTYVKRGKVPASRVARFVELSEGRVKKEDFLPYLLD